jgi:peptidoglycan/xylan/chitin deacetylase (PgdA/CDA1 family)
LATTPRLSACLTFDFDALSVWLGTMRTTSPASLSRGEFGPYALPRILDLLKRYDIRSTFFVPGHTALAYPDLVKRIRDEGHEIGHHGYVHEDPASLDEATERDVFAQGLEALDKVAGVTPRGYRSPGADFSPKTIDILLENDIIYDATLCGSDFIPYYIRQGDVASFNNPFEFGSTSELVGIPFSWGLDDWPHLEFSPGWSTGQKPPSAVLEIWKSEFDYAHAHVPGGVFDLTMHPQIIGRGSRLTMLEQLINHIASHENVVFEPLIDYALRWRERNPLSAWLASSPSHAAPQPARLLGVTGA